MSDDGDGGTDNPAFSNDEETSYDNSASTASAGRNSETGTPTGHDAGEVTENGKNHCTFGTRTSPEPSQQLPNETRIELPEDAMPEKTPNKSKQNGVHGNGNNNDVSFLNTTVTSVSNNDINDKKEQIEAVNLELVSMKPYAGTNNLQTKNQEACEVPANPYEEYFVPVNEHRKYIRGEKLYVTKDKRSRSSYWKRILCWGCGILIVAIIAIVAILAATGVILTQEATQPLLNGEKTNYEQFNEVRAAGSQEYVKNPPPSPPPATSTFPPWQTTDETLYKFVPKALDGVIKLDDLEWNEDMNDPKSRVYRDIAKDIENNLVNMLRLDNDIPLIKVYSISKDGEVQFRVSHPVYEKADDTQAYLEDKFRENGNIISNYHVNRLMISSLVDECYIEKMGCSDNCAYDYVEGTFTCTCPTGKSLDKTGKTCINDSDLSNINVDETVSDNVQGRSRMPDDIYHTHDHHWKNSNYDVHHEHESPDSEPKSEPEPSAEPTSEPEAAEEPKSKSETTAEPKSEPEPSAEPAAEPTSEEPSAEPKSEPEPAVEPTSQPEPAAEPTSEEPSAEPKSAPEPAPEPTSEEPIAEPKSEPEPSAEPTSEPESAAEPKSEPEPSLEPQSEPEPVAEPKSEPEPSTEPKNEHEPPAEPTSQPEPVAEPASEEPSAEPNSEPEPSAEPSAEPKSVPEPSTEPKSVPEPAAEHTSEEPSAEPKSEPEPAAEPTSQPEPAAEPTNGEPSAEPKTEPEPAPEPTSEEPVAEPKSEPEPAAEPKSEPEPAAEPKSDSEPAAEPKREPEPVVEPKSEPDPSAQPNTNSEAISEAKGEQEPISEPTSKAEPSAEVKSDYDSTVESTDEFVPIEKSKAEPELVVEPKSLPEPNNKPESADESTDDQSKSTVEPKSKKSTVKTEDKLEISTEPTSEPEQVIEIQNTQVNEPSSDAQLIPEPKSGSEIVKLISDLESTTEPKNETQLTVTTIQPESHMESSTEDKNQVITIEKKNESDQKSEKQSQDEPKVNSETPSELTSSTESSPDTNNELKPLTETKSSEISAESMIESESPTESTIISETPLKKSEPESTVMLKQEPENSTFKNNQEQFVIPQIEHELSIATELKTESSTEINNDTLLMEIKSGSELTPEMESKTETQEVNTESSVFTDAGINMKNESESSTASSEPPTVIGLNEKKADEKETSTELYKEQHSSTEIPLQEHVTTELKNDSFLNKEFVKKAPRLDKDEQDNPNPFEMNVKDVITSSTNDKMINDMDNKTHENDNVPTTTQSSAEENKKDEHENPLRELNKKNEENAEDQYNDITDETIPKGFEKNDIESSQNIKKDEKKIQKVYKENKNIDYKISKLDTERLNKTSLELTTLPAIDGLDKHSEDQSMTSQVPILPIEIQLDMSTTEIVESVDTHAISQDSEKEIISTTTLPKILHLDGKTTEQIPILPEELQTTDINKNEQHTESTLVYQIDKRVDELLGGTDDDAEMLQNDSTTKSNETVPISETDKEVVVTTHINPESTTLIHDVMEEIANVLSNDTLNETNNSTMAVDIKPVSETISDDTTPQTFEYTFLRTTTTEKSELPNEFEELSEEQLRVVPLEEKDEFQQKLKSDDQQTKFKKEKELNLKATSENVESISTDVFKSSEIVSNLDAKTSRNVEDDNIPKLTSGTSDLNLNPKNNLKTVDPMPAFNDSNLHESDINNDNNLKSSTIKYPNIIPVSEEIDETDFTEPPVMLPFNIPHISTTNLPETVTEDKSLEDTDIKTLTTENILEPNIANSTLLGDFVLNNSTENNENVQKIENKEANVDVTSTSYIPDVNSEILGIPVSILTTEEETPQIFFSKCKSGQFQCVNGTSRDGAYCVSLSAKCDSENDCSDGSDEVNCEQEGCPGNFQCASGQCLKRHLVCNGIVDCDDGSDEKECGKWTCNFDEFQCPNGRCIPVLWQCDGRPDCENHADEYSCSESCGNDEYLCPIEKWCIPQTWRCNGVSECVNGEDEKLCECAVDQYKCETGGCIPAEQICDGVENCPDRSDEWNCLSDFSKNASISTESNTDKENKDNEFSTRISLVKIRQSTGDYRFICSDGWTEEFSDQYCRSLGFASSESTQYMEQGTNKNLLQLIPNANPKSPLVINLEKVTFCKSEKIVEISCQEFVCGSHENVGPTARLVGGTPASEGQWSSVALLKEPKYGAACTASVLSPMHALASYSCIYSYRQSSGWQLFVGGNLLKPHKVKNIVPYPQVKYNQFLYNNDIALVELAEPLIFSRNVSAVCLPSQSFQPRQLCVTAGWGFPVNGEVDLQQYLKFLPVPTYDSEECNATSHYAGFITKHNICAGFTDTDKGPCYNDEGAPLMCVSETGRWEIQGLLSHHSRCSRGHPAIYSSLAPALSWLRNFVPALQVHS